MATTATEARRKIRTTARHIAHISKDAGPLALQQLHADLGRAIADLATANYQANKTTVDAAVAAAHAAGATHQEVQAHLDKIRERRPDLARTIDAGFAVLDEQADKAGK